MTSQEILAALERAYPRLNILLAGMTLIFVLAVVTIPSFAAYAGGNVPVIVLVALFVTLNLIRRVRRG